MEEKSVKKNWRSPGILLVAILCLLSALPVSANSFSNLPNTTKLLVSFDLSSAADSALLKPIQDQLVQASKSEKVLERFLFLSGMNLSEEASRLTIAKLSSDSDELLTIGVIVGSFSDLTRRAIELSQRLMEDREFRVVQLGTDRVVFGDAEGVRLYLEPDQPLNPEVLQRLKDLQSESPVFGWMQKGGLGKSIPDDFSLFPQPRWSLLWARDQIIEQTFTGEIGASVDFDLELRVSDQAAVEVLKDETVAYFETLTRRGERDELKESLNSAQFGAEGSSLSLSFDLSEKALEQFGGESGFNGLLNWQNRASNREGWQKLGELFEAAGIQAGDQVADVGAGRGFLSVRLARVVGEAGRVWAVDIDEESVDIVKKRAEKAPYVQIRSLVGAVDDPGLPEGELDAIFIVDAYHEMVEYETMLEHFRKSLKPGGKLLIVDQWNEKLKTSPREKQVEDHYISPDLVEAEVRKAGFEIRSRQDNFTDRWDVCLIVATPAGVEDLH